jgi:hypothetical protein
MLVGGWGFGNFRDEAGHRVSFAGTRFVDGDVTYPGFEVTDGRVEERQGSPGRGTAGRATWSSKRLRSPAVVAMIVEADSQGPNQVGLT